MREGEGREKRKRERERETRSGKSDREKKYCKTIKITPRNGAFPSFFLSFFFSILGRNDGNGNGIQVGDWGGVGCGRGAPFLPLPI